MKDLRWSRKEINETMKQINLPVGPTSHPFSQEWYEVMAGNRRIEDILKNNNNNANGGNKHGF